MKSLVREVGNWVSGERFWNRQAEIREFMELIDEGAHILLVAPRRVGKTSLMHEVGGRLSDRYTSIYVDCRRHRPLRMPFWSSASPPESTEGCGRKPWRSSATS